MRIFNPSSKTRVNIISFKRLDFGAFGFEFKFDPCFLIGGILGKWLNQNELRGEGRSEGESNTSPARGWWKRLKRMCEKPPTQQTVAVSTVQLCLQNSRDRTGMAGVRQQAWGPSVGHNCLQTLFPYFHWKLVKEESLPEAVHPNFTH